MKQVKLKIDGMRCSMCESHINDCVRKGLPEAKKIKANHHSGVVTFVIDDEVDYSKAIETIQADGYKVLEQTTEPYEKKGLFSFFKK